MLLKPLVVSLSLLCGPALADVQSCKKLFERAPQVLSDLNQIGSEVYEDSHPGLGYSTTFADPSSKITVFFYDHQQRDVSSEMALESFKQAARDIAAIAARRGAELGEINAYQLRDPSQVLPYRAEAKASDGLSELLAVGVVDNCIVKLRFTAQFPMEKAQVWMKVLSDYLNKGYGKPT
ncbi:hypothetical protein [Ruegeria sp. HKCCA0235A]|uniref:hypothetical protein n=1 Tax=Ruegeria sp. HKCCA0235A TaxID=2682998 RepID=UPI0014882A43|nr:hypothetical protein [Ruegeria sp. HKCCA0235A]